MVPAPAMQTGVISGRMANGAIIIRTGIDDRGCFEVPLVDDNLMENSERFAVVFRNATPAGRVDFFELNREGEYSEFGGLGSSEYEVLPSNRPAVSLGRLDVVIEDDDLGVVISTPSLTFVEGAAVTDANRYTVNLIEAPGQGCDRHAQCQRQSSCHHHAGDTGFYPGNWDGGANPCGYIDEG